MDKYSTVRLEKYGAFPSCMVDCITPNTSDSHRKLVAHEFGILDKWPVTCETFRQWVIEDHFPLGRPAWETVGVQMVQDVVPYELMKLRLLNGPQFLCGVLGVVLGYRHFPEAMGDASVRRMVRLLMDEVTPFVPPISDIDLEKYKDKLMERFANPALNDQLMRIVHSLSRDGSSKIRQFILPCVRDAIKAGSCFPVTFSAFAVAIWIFYLGQDVDAVGNTLDFTDARQQALHVTAQGCGTDARRFLKMKDIFGDDLADEPRFADEVQIILEKLYEHGARFAVDQHV